MKNKSKYYDGMLRDALAWVIVLCIPVAGFVACGKTDKQVEPAVMTFYLTSYLIMIRCRSGEWSVPH